jgi:large-conductance mechanosensitive channel
MSVVSSLLRIVITLVLLFALTAGAQQISQPAQATSAPQIGETPHPLLDHLRSGMILDYATFLVAIITLIFTFFIGIFAVREWQKFLTVKKELAAQREELMQQRTALQEQLTAIAQQRNELAAERRQFQGQVESFRSEISAQEMRLSNGQRFLEAVLSTQSSLLVGIVEGFGSALNPQDAQKIAALIFEAESALYLFYPEKTEVLKALLKLEQVGSDSSVAPLVQLRDDPQTDGDLRVRAQQVLTTVKERIRRHRYPVVPAPSLTLTGPTTVIPAVDVPTVSVDPFSPKTT